MNENINSGNALACEKCGFSCVTALQSVLQCAADRY